VKHKKIAAPLKTRKPQKPRKPKERLIYHFYLNSELQSGAGQGSLLIYFKYIVYTTSYLG